MRRPVQQTRINNLPLELLIVIFDFSILTQSTSDAGSKRQGDAAAVQRTLLRGVSQKWNSIILSDPRYWNCITLDLREICDEIDKLVAGYDWVRQCMQRSDPLPCHLRLIDPGDPCEDDEDVDPCVLGCSDNVQYCSPLGLEEFLRSTRAQWSNVYISVEHHHLLPVDIFGDRFGCLYHWSALKSLTLTTTAEAWPTREDGSLFRTDALWMDVEHFPALRELCVKLPFCALENWTFPWAQLTTLKLAGLYDDLATYIIILGQSSSLEVFHLALPPRNPPSEQIQYPTKPLTVPRLKDIELVVPFSETSTFGARMFDKLTLPALQVVTLAGRTDEEAFCESFLRMLDRSRLDGRRLRLDFEKSDIPARAITHGSTIY